MAAIDNVGNVVYITQSYYGSDYEEGQKVGEYTLHEVPSGIENTVILALYYWVDGWRVKPDKPGEFYAWDMVNEIWIPDLEAARKRTIDVIVYARITANKTPFLYQDKLFESNSTKIYNTTQKAMIAIALNKPFSVNWSSLDGTIFTLTAINMLELSDAYNTKIDAAMAKEDGYRLAIENATIIDEIVSIKWVD